MNLSKLLAQYGDDALQFQKMDDCVVSLQLTKQGSKATFVTPVAFGSDGFQKLGLIVWLDRDRTKQLLAAEKHAGAES